MANSNSKPAQQQPAMASDGAPDFDDDIPF